MNDFGTITTTMAMLASPQSREQVSDKDLAALLHGRKFGNRAEDYCHSDMNPVIPDYDEDEMAELQDYCRQRGIIGINFNGMRPSAILKMLKGKMGMSEQTTKKGILKG